jgi:sulfur carrier protein
VSALSITLNGEPYELPSICTVADLLAQLDTGGKRVAIAVNRAVVPRSSYAATAIDPGDHVEVLEAVGGG